MDMLREEVKDNNSSSSKASGGRRTYSRSVSWTDRSPSISSRKPANSTNKPRPLLPPLQPLSIDKRSVLEEWPSAGSDDLGVWPLPQTPRGSIRPCDPGHPMKDFQFKRDKLAFFDKECSRIAEHIYLGSDTVAKNHELLRQKGITHVLNCVGFVCPEYFKSDFVYKTLWLQDTPSEDITSILYDVFDYFEDVRGQGGRILVHCCQGVSRSSSLVIAYLMWREGQSFEDAFQYVKNARGVTNPNMGFACQLLQCQKRVHALPASPNSSLRMYRMAPHSPYDPLHLVPKMVNQPGEKALDSRGAFIVHVPSAIYVWNGNNCSSVMACNARGAAYQVVRYEKAKGPILTIHEGQEPPQFWIALSGNNISNSSDEGGLMEEEEPALLLPPSQRRKIDAYDSDFEIFHQALAGGVVPPFSVSGAAGSETCLPAREHGWGILRRKLATGVMKGLLNSPKWNCDVVSCNDASSNSSLVMGEENLPSMDKPFSPLSHLCGSPDSFECYLNNSSDRAKDAPDPQVMDPSVSVPGASSLSLPPTPRGTSNPFPCYLTNIPEFNCKSPTLSPSSSDSASSFTFSPSSATWSDLSLSSRQPSPSDLESTDQVYAKEASFSESSSSFHNKEAATSPSEAFLENSLGGANSYFMPLKQSSPSIAEQLGSNLPPRMLLSSIKESSHVHKNLCNKKGAIVSGS